MSNDSDWVEDVRRWYFGGTAPAGDSSSGMTEASSTYETALGYEAAHPSLQSHHWPDLPLPGREIKPGSSQDRASN